MDRRQRDTEIHVWRSASRRGHHAPLGLARPVPARRPHQRRSRPPLPHRLGIALRLFFEPDLPRLLLLTNLDHTWLHPPPHTLESGTTHAQIPIRTNLRLRVQIRNPVFHPRPPLGHHF